MFSKSDSSPRWDRFLHADRHLGPLLYVLDPNACIRVLVMWACNRPGSQHVPVRSRRGLELGFREAPDYRPFPGLRGLLSCVRTPHLYLTSTGSLTDGYRICATYLTCLLTWALAPVRSPREPFSNPRMFTLTRSVGNTP
jgi:hypothetical protein